MTGSYKLNKEKEYIYFFVDLYFLVSTRPEARTLKSTTVLFIQKKKNQPLYGLENKRKLCV